jgi:hypothetical protein
VIGNGRLRTGIGMGGLEGGGKFASCSTWFVFEEKAGGWPEDEEVDASWLGKI